METEPIENVEHFSLHEKPMQQSTATSNHEVILAIESSCIAVTLLNGISNKAEGPLTGVSIPCIIGAVAVGMENINILYLPL